MSGANDMTMAIRITAAGNQALAVIGQVNRAVRTTSELGARMGRTVAGTGRAIGSAFSAALAPARMLATAGLGLSLVFGGLSAKAISASGDMEVLKLRLEGVSASAEQARNIFEETNRMAVQSPFTPQELVDARIGLLGLGITGADALRKVGDASAITQRPVGDLVGMLAAMNTRSLRAIGIELSQNAGNFEFTFRDKIGNVQRIVAQGAEGAREALLSIFDIRFGGGMARFAAAWKGLTSTLQGLMQQAAAGFGDGLMPVAKRFVDGLNQRLTALIESGKLTEWGTAVGEIISGAWDRAEAVIGFAQDVATNLRQTPGSMGEGLAMVMGTAGQMLAMTFANYLSGMSQIFVALAKMMSAAFLEDILQLPFMGNTRMDMAAANLSKMTDEEYAAFAKENNVKPGTGGWFDSGFTKEQEAKLAAGGRGKMMEDAASSIPATIARIAGETAGANKEMLRGLQADLLKLAGGSITGVGERVAEARAERERLEREGQMKSLVEVQLLQPGRMIERDGMAGMSDPSMQTYHMTREQSARLSAGQQVAGGTIINIGEFRGTFTDWEQVSRAIEKAAGAPVLAMGGAY